jgi:hypothetical protein
MIGSRAVMWFIAVCQNSSFPISDQTFQNMILFLFERGKTVKHIVHSTGDTCFALWADFGSVAVCWCSHLEFIDGLVATM